MSSYQIWTLTYDVAMGVGSLLNMCDPEMFYPSQLRIIFDGRKLPGVLKESYPYLHNGKFRWPPLGWLSHATFWKWETFRVKENTAVNRVCSKLGWCKSGFYCATKLVLQYTFSLVRFFLKLDIPEQHWKYFW